MNFVKFDITKMPWVLNGKKVKGLYLDTIQVEGTVSRSEVALGNRVKYFVDLDTPVEIYGRIAENVILTNETVMEVVL